MKITIVVDAQPFFSALLGGAARRIFFNPRFRFVTTEFTLDEIRKYVPFISEKSGVAAAEVSVALELLPVSVFQQPYYKGEIPDAEKLIGARDPKDVDILALTLAMHAPLWTEDKDFDGISGISVIRTKDLI